jgi:hypothetical protein
MPKKQPDKENELRRPEASELRRPETGSKTPSEQSASKGGGLLDKISGAAPPAARRRKVPLWRGPEVDGITQSLLAKFLECRERFRLLVVEGLSAESGWNHRLGYGNMWHKCEEHHAAGTPWTEPLRDYCRSLCAAHPTQQAEIDKWYNVCRVQFPRYVAYWSMHEDEGLRRPLLQEHCFSVPYKLPSGRTVLLRGKWDSVDVIGAPSNGARASEGGRQVGPETVYLQENKTKGNVNEHQLKRQLTFDLQTMLYLVAMHEGRYESPLIDVIPKGSVLAGVRYNVIRRPLSGGKGSIVRHKPSKRNPAGESAAEFYGRLGGIISEDSGSYFMRWQVEVGPHDIAAFKDQCLNPILEQLCDWWEWVSLITARGGSVWDNDVLFGGRPDLDDNGRHSSAIHWRTPYGLWNSMAEGVPTELDEHLSSGSMVGLTRIDTLYPELKEGD